MANLFVRYFRKLTSNKRCSYCHRSYEDAVKDQVERQHVCECPPNRCKFNDEIREAILFSKTPELVEFVSDKYATVVDEPITLSWELNNIKSCSIKDGLELAPKGTKLIQLKESTNIVLEFEAFNGDLYNSEPIEIKVYPAPIFVDYSISKLQILKGQSIRLLWKSLNILDSYLLLNGISSKVNSDDSIELKPAEDLEIELILIGNLGIDIRKHEQVLVHEHAKLITFISNKLQLLEKEDIVFTYEAINFSKVYLTGPSIRGHIDVTANDSFKHTIEIENNHTVTQTFYLEVFDRVNNLLPKKSVDIIVYPLFYSPFLRPANVFS